MSEPKIFETIDALVAGLPLTPDKAAKTLGARLERDPDSDTAAAQAYALSSKVRGGPYETVDLRIPDEDIGDAQVFLSVTLRSDEGVDEDAIAEHYGTDFRTEVPSPRYPPGTVPVYLIYEQEWGTLSFGVSADDARRLVRFILSAKAG
jgi:hypothetical protein